RPDAATDQRTRGGSAPATGQSADCRTGPRTEQPATNGALPGIVWVSARRQCESHTERRGGGCKRTLHDIDISFRVASSRPQSFLPHDPCDVDHSSRRSWHAIVMTKAI